MSAFYNEVLLRLGMSPEETVGSKITVIDLKGVFIEGHRGIISYSPSEIFIGLKRKVLKISGENMCVFAVNKDEIFIKGKIVSCEVTDGR